MQNFNLSFMLGLLGLFSCFVYYSTSASNFDRHPAAIWQPDVIAGNIVKRSLDSTLPVECPRCCINLHNSFAAYSNSSTCPDNYVRATTNQHCHSNIYRIRMRMTICTPEKNTYQGCIGPYVPACACDRLQGNKTRLTRIPTYYQCLQRSCELSLRNVPLWNRINGTPNRAQCTEDMTYCNVHGCNDNQQSVIVSSSVAPCPFA